MNEEDQPLRQTVLGKHGCISFAARSGVRYKWMLHESEQWFNRAKQVQGPEWYWSGDVEPIEYVFDTLGFRNNKEIDEVSGHDRWWLFIGGCSGIAPGVHTKDMVSNLISKYADIPVYNMSTYGDRPEFILNNILEMSKRWFNEPSRIIVQMAENFTGTYKLSNTNQISNLDYAGSMLKGGNTFTFLRPYEEQKISVGQHRLAYKTIIDWCYTNTIPLTWLYTGHPDKNATYNEYPLQDFIKVFGHNSASYFEKSDSFDDRTEKVRDMIIKPFMECKVAANLTADDVGRDLYHPSAMKQKTMAQKITNHFLETKRNF